MLKRRVRYGGFFNPTEAAPFSLSWKMVVACANEATVNALEIVTGGTPHSSSGGDSDAAAGETTASGEQKTGPMDVKTSQKMPRKFVPKNLHQCVLVVFNLWE